MEVFQPAEEQVLHHWQQEQHSDDDHRQHDELNDRQSRGEEETQVRRVLTEGINGADGVHHVVSRVDVVSKLHFEGVKRGELSRGEGSGV